MTRQTRNLAKTAAALAASALLEKALERAAEDPRIRRKAKAVTQALKKRVKAFSKKVVKAAKKRAPKIKRAGRSGGRKRVRA
jgi:hypothetical protein